MRLHESTIGSATRGLAAFGLAVLALGAGACERESDVGVDIQEINADPAVYYGRVVAVTGEVERVYGDRLMAIEDEGVAGNQILVLGRMPLEHMMKLPAQQEVIEGAEVMVSGTVRRFAVADIERELDLDFTPEVEVEVRDRPVIIADTIQRIPD